MDRIKLRRNNKGANLNILLAAAFATMVEPYIYYGTRNKNKMKTTRGGTNVKRAIFLAFGIPLYFSRYFVIIKSVY